MSLFSDKIYPQLVRRFYANFEKVEPRGKGGTYSTTKVKDTIITLTTATIERIFNLNLDPSTFPPLMSAAKAQKLLTEKYVHPSKIK